jgi:hypothetical protein
MAFAPRCPRPGCRMSNLILTPIDVRIPPTGDVSASEVPVCCTECNWQGTLADVEWIQQ